MEELPERNSAWADYIRIYALVCLLLSVVGFGLALFSNSLMRMYYVTASVACILHSVFAYFVAFLTDVFTEIRWYLARIDSKIKKQ